MSWKHVHERFVTKNKITNKTDNLPDKNKLVVHSVGIDVLLNQLACDDPRVQEKALHCICYAAMNGMSLSLY